MIATTILLCHYTKKEIYLRWRGKPKAVMPHETTLQLLSYSRASARQSRCRKALPFL